MSVRRLILLGVLLWLALAPSTARAHKVPPEVVAFFKVEGARLRVAVRVPTAILLDARMPMVETIFLDLPNIEPSLRTIGAEVVRSLDLTEAGRPLQASAPRWVLTPFADKAGAAAFTTFDRAVQRFAATPAIPDGDQKIYWNEAWVDYLFEYALPGGGPKVAARLNGLRTGGDFFQTTATYVAADGDTRSVTVVGPPQRVVFEPTAGQALSTVVRQGVDRLVNERLIWLFALCLAVPLRRGRAAVIPFAAFALAQAVTLLLFSRRDAALSDAAWDVTQFVAGAGVMLAAVQALLASGVTATAAVAAAVGLASGVILGTRLHEVMPLAGSHGALVLTAFTALVIASLGLWVAVLASVVRLAYRATAPAWLIAAAFCAVPAHEAAHQVIDAAARLGGVEPWTLSPPLALLVTHWPALVLVASAGLLWLLSVAGRLTPATEEGPRS